MNKGKETKKKIMDMGFELASTLGLECLSIGTLAKATSMSKSGLFGHFNSKENLQLAVMKHAGGIFRNEVIIPALKTERGIPRIKKITDCWINWSIHLTGGCIFVAAAAEYSDRSGPIKDCINKQHDLWIECLERITQSAVTTGDFKENTNCSLFAFELYSLILGFFLYYNALDYPGARDLVDASVERLINSYKS